MVTASFGRPAGVRGGGSGLLRVAAWVSVVLFIETGVAGCFYFLATGRSVQALLLVV